MNPAKLFQPTSGDLHVLDEKLSGNIRAQLVVRRPEPTSSGYIIPERHAVDYSVACYSDEYAQIVHEPVSALALHHLGFGREVDALSMSLLPERWQHPDPTSLLAATQETPE